MKPTLTIEDLCAEAAKFAEIESLHYDKYDDSENRTGRLNMQHTIFIERSRTADFPG